MWSFAPCSRMRLRKMLVLGILFMRTIRTPRVELQCRIVEILVSDFAGVEASQRVVPHEQEKLATISIGRTCFFFVGKQGSERNLLVFSPLQERFFVALF